MEEITEIAPKIREKRHFRDFEVEGDAKKASIVFTPKDQESYQNLFSSLSTSEMS